MENYTSGFLATVWDVKIKKIDLKKQKKESETHQDRDKEFQIHCKSIEMDQLDNELEELQLGSNSKLYHSISVKLMYNP